MPPTAANRLGLDYRSEAARLRAPVVPMVDAHCHVNGPRSALIFRQAAELYGISRVYSMTRITEAEAVRDALGDFVRFIAFPNFGAGDRGRAFRAGFVDDIPVWHSRFGARVAKLWAAPRMRDLVKDPEDVAALDSEWRIKAAEAAAALGMVIIAHVADPDTWFATKYADATRYGTKRSHYVALERMLDRFPVPWIAAHMGGSAEDLDFLDGLLERHPNLYLDTSATKWVVRELGRHDPARVRDFFVRWQGRLLFGSDIVTTDEHLAPKPASAHPMGDLADSPEAAFELYASRYYTLRTLLETGHVGESPIADPDLAMVDPARHDAMSAPMLLGISLPPSVLRSLYSGVAERLLGA